jgi:hypothetical protein
VGFFKRIGGTSGALEETWEQFRSSVFKEVGTMKKKTKKVAAKNEGARCALRIELRRL